MKHFDFFDVVNFILALLSFLFYGIAIRVQWKILKLHYNDYTPIAFIIFNVLQVIIIGIGIMTRVFNNKPLSIAFFLVSLICAAIVMKSYSKNGWKK